MIHTSSWPPGVSGGKRCGGGQWTSELSHRGPSYGRIRLIFANNPGEGGRRNGKLEGTPSLRQRLFYAGGRIGGGVYDGFNTAILSLYLGGLTNNNFIIGYLSNSKTMEGVVIQPLVGRWSDRTANRLGRRKPFILFGAPLSALFLILAAHAGHLGSSLALPLVALAIVLFSIAYNVAGDPYDALMVDITPPRGRAPFNAVLNIVSLVGFIGITLFASFASVKKNAIPDSVFYITAAAIVVGYALVLIGVREPPDAQG